MQFIRPDVNLDFIGKRKFACIFSAIMILISIGTLITHGGPRYGIDFAGGTVIQIKFNAATKISDIKSALRQLGIDASSVQQFGDHKNFEYLIRTDIASETADDISLKIEKTLENITGNKAEIRRVEMVGPQVGKDLREKALLAMFFALLFITIYPKRDTGSWCFTGFRLCF